MSGEESDSHSPLFSFTDYIFQLLDLSLDLGIDEFTFWEMNLEELIRAITSKQRTKRKEAEEKAMSDYLLADMIGRSVARVYSSDAKMPEIYDVYPTLFNKDEIEEARERHRMEESLKKFKDFAVSFNERFVKGEEIAND